MNQGDTPTKVPLNGAVRPLALDVTANEAGRQIARALFVLGESAGAPCSRIAFKMGVYPDNERDGGGFAEKPLAEWIARELDKMERRARNEPAA